MTEKKFFDNERNGNCQECPIKLQNKDYLDIIKELKEIIANHEQVIERYDKLVENYEKTTKDLIGSIK